MKRFFLLFFILGVNNLYASHGDPIDSDQLDPPETLPGKRPGYVLVTGGFMVNCKFGYRAGCEKIISSKICPPQYNPQVTTSVAASGGCRFGIQQINLFPQQGILMTKSDGYHLGFIQGYASTSQLCGGEVPLHINYSVYCT